MYNSDAPIPAPLIPETPKPELLCIHSKTSPLDTVLSNDLAADPLPVRSPFTVKTEDMVTPFFLRYIRLVALPPSELPEYEDV